MENGLLFSLRKAKRDLLALALAIFSRPRRLRSILLHLPLDRFSLHCITFRILFIFLVRGWGREEASEEVAGGGGGVGLIENRGKGAGVIRGGGVGRNDARGMSGGRGGRGLNIFLGGARTSH